MKAPVDTHPSESAWVSPVASESMLDKALAMWELGFHIFPLKPYGKKPVIEAWTPYRKTAPTEDQIRRWWSEFPDANIAIITGLPGGVNVVDADDRVAMTWCCNSNNLTPSLAKVVTDKGAHYYYSYGAINVNNSAGNGLDTRGAGGYVVAPGSIHESGHVYRLELALGCEDAWPGNLTTLTQQDSDRIAAYQNDFNIDTRGIRLPVSDEPAPIGQRNDSLTRLAGRWFALGYSYEHALENGQNWNATNAQPLADNEVHTVIRSVMQTHNRNHPESPVEVEAEIDKDLDAWPPPLQIEKSGYPCTDTANAQRYAENFGGEILHIDGIGWHRWDNSCWVHDEHHADKRAQEISLIILRESSLCTQAAMAENSKEKRDALTEKSTALNKWARSSEFNIRIAATKKLATAHLSYKAAEFDADPMLLNCSNGTLDLRTGEFRAARKGDLCTKTTGVPYDPGASYELWAQTVLDICCGDKELMRYLQRVFGYCLTGDIREQAMFIFNGSGANGKDTVLGRVKKAMGDYAGMAAPNLLMESRSERHPTEIADLRGVRIAIAAESSDNHRLHETRVKQLTGSEIQKARMMRQDYFEFPTQFKLILMTNHKPVIKGDDLAMWRRLQLVPFNQTYRKGENRDDMLPGRLDLELPGILRWCVEGCMEWQRGGLRPPEVVIQHTAQYRAEQDVFAQFLEDCCVLKPTEQVTARKFYETYEKWCTENGERRQSQKWLWPKLQERGISKRKQSTGRLYQGIGLLHKNLSYE